MPMTYLDRYQQHFQLVRFNKLPEHMMYFVHSGHAQSTDIDDTKYHKTLSEPFLFNKPIQLRNLSYIELQQTIDQLHYAVYCRK
ncbi:MAG: hypothetical protein CMF50_02410 [Legionellales bacterium]|nr:hypothetical protein [Legionellales bacterium]|tara:strand:- start:51293 stop:51544 length:252 start_codon:yes stop_codon:yes gene_type:complete